MVKRLKSDLKQIIINDLKGYILILCVFIAGAALSYVINVSSGIEGEIRLYINDFVSAVKNYSTDSDATFSTAMLSYVNGIVILFLMSLSVVGSIGILIFVFVKGFSYGIVLISMFSVMETKAILLFFCLILPHALVMIPCFLVYSLFCFKNAYMLTKGPKDIKSYIIKPIVYGGFCFSFLSVSALIQAYVEPLLTRVVI